MLLVCLALSLCEFVYTYLIFKIWVMYQSIPPVPVLPWATPGHKHFFNWKIYQDWDT